MFMFYESNITDNPFNPYTSIISVNNTRFIGNMDHTSPLTFQCGFRKIEKCEIQENKHSTSGESILEVVFKVNIFKNTDALDYTLDVTDLLRIGIKTFEKITYEDSDIQLFYGIKDDSERILLFIVDSFEDKYLYDIFFIDGLQDHTGTIYFREKDNSITGFKTIATLDFVYLGNPLNFVYLPLFYNEDNFNIKYPGYDDIKGTKISDDLYLPDNYSIETDDDHLKSLDLILHYLDDPHIKLFNIPVPFIIKEKESGKGNRIYFKSLKTLNDGSIHNYLEVQYGRKRKDGLYDKGYLSLIYYESSREYGVKEETNDSEKVT